MREYFDQLQRQAREMEQFFRPYRDLHEQLLKSLAPSLQTSGLLRDIPALLAGLPSQKDLLASFQPTAGPRLTDFASVEGLLNPHVRDLQRTFEAFSAQTRWIEEAVRLATRPRQELANIHAGFAAIEKLAASRSALFDKANWVSPRPFGSALTDILYAGRSSWALIYAGTPAPRQTEEKVTRVARESEVVIAEFAKASEGAEQRIPAAEARREATAVSEFLSERTAESAEPSLSSPIAVPEPILIGSLGLLVTLAEVMQIVETRTGKAIAGGYSAWALRRGLHLMDGNRSPQDRFGGLVRFLYDFWVEGVDHAEQKLRDCRPHFFSVTIRDLRNTDAAHTPETSNKVARVAVNLELRERRLKEIAGRVPVTSDEWAQALISLLGRAAEAAKEFRDRLS